MNFTNPFLDRDGDKLREECGVFGVIGAKDAAAMTALGLHALQHRGQEAVGMTSFDGSEFYSHRGIGHVAQVFNSAERLGELPGAMASGHVRYSTTGGSGLQSTPPSRKPSIATPAGPRGQLRRGSTSSNANGISNACCRPTPPRSPSPARASAP